MSELVDLTQKRIRDPRLRNIIFGAEQLEERTITGNIIYCMNNIMLISFFGFFILWKHRNEFETSATESANTKRIDNIFSDLFTSNVLSTELIAFLLTEIQLGASKHGGEFYNKYIKDNITSSKFQQISEIIRVWRINYKHAEQNIEKLTSLYIELIKSLPLLRKMSVNDRDGKFEFIIDTDDDIICEDMSHFIKIIEYDFDSNYYFLYRANKVENIIELEYMDFSGASTCRGDANGDFSISIGDFRKIIGRSGSQSIINNTAKNLNMLNFKYIRRLAMAITDVLKKGTKRLIKTIYGVNRKYKDIFDSGNIDDLNWDNIIVLLMLEEGPSDIIEEVIKNDANAFDEILENISVRFGLDLTQLNRKYEQLKQTEEKYEETQHKGFKSIRQLSLWRRSTEIALMAQFIVSSVADINIDNVTTNACYAESLSMKKQKIEALRNEGSDVEVIRILNKTLERIFKMLIVFYKGVVSYAQKREEILKEVIDLRVRQSEEFLISLQKSCEKSFFDAVKVAMNQRTESGKSLNNSSLGILISMFEKQCLSMGTKHGDFFVQHSEQGKLIHSVLGRSEICDVSQLRKIIRIKQGDVEGKNYPKDLLEFFNKYLKHDDVTTDIPDDIVDKYYSCSIELLKFLAFNKDYIREGRVCHQVIYDPIFPYVVRYSEKSENRDRCSVCQYVINTDGEFDKTKGVKLLTEFEYKINELYYCIPNAECSTQNWWVSPFLISCREFDSIFLKLSADEEGEN